MPIETSGETVNRCKRIFNLIRSKLRFQKKKTHSENTLWTAGSNTQKSRVSLANKPGEGVSLNLGRRIGIRWHGLDRKGERESVVAEEETDAAAAMNGGETLTGVRGLGPTEHRKTNRRHWEVAGKMANSLRGFSSVRSGPMTTRGAEWQMMSAAARDARVPRRYKLKRGRRLALGLGGGGVAWGAI